MLAPLGCPTGAPAKILCSAAEGCWLPSKLALGSVLTPTAVPAPPCVHLSYPLCSLSARLQASQILDCWQGIYQSCQRLQGGSPSNVGPCNFVAPSIMSGDVSSEKAVAMPGERAASDVFGAPVGGPSIVKGPTARMADVFIFFTKSFTLHNKDLSTITKCPSPETACSSYFSACCQFERACFTAPFAGCSAGGTG